MLFRSPVVAAMAMGRIVLVSVLVLAVRVARGAVPVAVVVVALTLMGAPTILRAVVAARLVIQ